MNRRDKPTQTDAAGKDSESSLFRDAMQGVTPLTPANRVIHVPTQLPPLPLQQRDTDADAPKDKDTLSDHNSLDIAAGDDWSYLRPGLSRQTLRRLRRGHWKIQAYLDLHGFTRVEARRELAAFLNTSSKMKFRCVRIIHGKGLGSKNRQPILKISVGNWLTQRQDVLAFCQARPEDGGGGAVLVLLKASA